MFKTNYFIFAYLLVTVVGIPVELKTQAGGVLQIKPNTEENALEVTITGTDQLPRIHGFLGLSLPSAVEQWTESECPSDGKNYQICATWGDYSNINIALDEDCFRFQWTSSFARQIDDCFDIESGVHWYGGGEMFTSIWPIETSPRQETAFVPGDSLADRDGFFGGVAERYWLLSNGVSLVVDPESPLFYSLNSTFPNRVCFTARDQTPFTKRSPLTFNYDICVANDVKDAHQTTIAKYFEKPEGIPDMKMLVQPLWSTWAEYKTEVNQSIVLDYARRVVAEGFNSSHIEIDDHWETCYGQEEFNPEKFPNAKEMISEIHEMGLRVTAWVHPFVNFECPLFTEGLNGGYFVKNSKGRVGITSWWQGSNAGIIDMTNEEATKWWTDRLRKLQEDTGLDSFKFDAGETNWLPASAALNSESNVWPQIYTQKYVETCATFGGLIETRAATLNQKQPVFIRMLDKDSRWGYDNGLRSMIPTLLQFSMNGYSFVLPDMIGGNNYGGEEITQEFYVRWMQANIFMPGVQFSLVPWRVGNTEAERQETVRLCLEVLEKRQRHADYIYHAARQSVEDGSPMNRPIWWVDPTDSVTFTIDDAYMLGDSLLVAPVLHEGQTTRDIYLPRGTWLSGLDYITTYTGPTWLRDFPAPLNTIPYFFLV